MTQTIDTSEIVTLREFTAYGHRVDLEEMPLAVFLQHPEIDTQRDTAGRADKAFRSHLKVDSPLHALVFVAKLPNGDRYVIDACTRRMLWAAGRKNPVETILAYTLQCASLEDARTMYFQLDSGTAVDKTADIAYGLLRAEHVAPSSELVRKSAYMTGLRKAFPLIPPKQLIGKAAGLLKMLDSLGLDRRTLPAGVVAAFFLTALRHGEDALEFWHEVVLGIGTSTEEGRTPAAALNRRVEVARTQNKLTGDRNVTKLMEMTLALYEAFQTDSQVLLPDDWHEAVKRETYVKLILSEDEEMTEWFVRPRKASTRVAKGGTEAGTKRRSSRIVRVPVDEPA
jgi:hypothetical protein